MVTEDLLQPGQVISNYRVERRIHRGVQTEIYRARSTEASGDLVALKCFHPRHAVSPRALDPVRFMRGIKRLRSLNDENVPHVHNGGVAGELYWFAMEYIEGPRLADDMNTLFDPYSTLLVLLYIRQIACRLRAAHARGILHGDLKPESILIVARFPGIKLLDIGCSELFGWNAETAALAPWYKAPEQLASGVMDERSDIYALGTMFYELLALRLPFSRTPGRPPVAELVKRKIHTAPTPIEVWLPETPECIRRFLAKSLARDPDERFNSFDEFLADLEQMERTVPALREQLSLVITRAMDALTTHQGQPAPRRESSAKKRASELWGMGDRSPVVKAGDEGNKRDEGSSGSAGAGDVKSAGSVESGPDAENTSEEPVTGSEPALPPVSDEDGSKSKEEPSGGETPLGGSGPTIDNARSFVPRVGEIEIDSGRGRTPDAMGPWSKPRPRRWLFACLRPALLIEASKGGALSWRMGLTGFFAATASAVALMCMLLSGENTSLALGVAWPWRWPVPSMMASAAPTASTVPSAQVPPPAKHPQVPPAADESVPTSAGAHRFHVSRARRTVPVVAPSSEARTSAAEASQDIKPCPGPLRCRHD